MHVCARCGHTVSVHPCSNHQLGACSCGEACVPSRAPLHSPQIYALQLRSAMRDARFLLTDRIAVRAYEVSDTAHWDA